MVWLALYKARDSQTKTVSRATASTAKRTRQFLSKQTFCFLSVQTNQTIKIRMAIKMAVCTLVSLFLIIETCWAFPNGGPIDACVKAQPNRPNHGGTEPQSPSTNPFIVEASSDYYRPGDKITGEFLVSLIERLKLNSTRNVFKNEINFKIFQ